MNSTLSISLRTLIGPTIIDKIFLYTEVDKGIEKAATIVARLTIRVDKPQAGSETKMAVYNAYVISTLLYDSETRTT